MTHNASFDSSCALILQNLQDMNAARNRKYGELLSTYADCHRKVFPVINTCLDNITEASNSVNPEQVNSGQEQAT